MVLPELVLSTNGMPAAAASVARCRSASWRVMVARPVGAMINGAPAGAPSIVVSSRVARSPRRMRGTRHTRSKSARLARSVRSSVAAPSMKSNTARGSRARAIVRRSSTEIARETSIVAGSVPLSAVPRPSTRRVAR